MRFRRQLRFLPPVYLWVASEIFRASFLFLNPAITGENALAFRSFIFNLCFLFKSLVGRVRRDMAAALKIKNGSKLQLAFDTPIGKEPVFDMVCTFQKALDESAFLISIPMRGGQPLQMDENVKLLFRCGAGADATILAGYPDDLVKDGIRRYWKIRRVTEQRQFFKRADERLKVALRMNYWQDTWPLNDDGQIEKNDGMTLDISNGGAAIYLNRHFDVGEVCMLDLPRVGLGAEGAALSGLVAAVCWAREAPKGSLYRFICGLQFRFGDPSESDRVKAYVANIQKKYKL
jgi:hypothetical protein